MNIALIGYEANIKNRVGSNQYAFEVMRELYGLDRENTYTVYLPTSPLADMPPEKEGWRYEIVGPGKLWNLLGLSLALWQNRKKIDLVFSPGHYAPVFSPRPLVMAIMDLGYLRFPDQFTKPIFWKLNLWTLFSIRKADHILAISEFTRQDIIKTYKIDPEKVTTTRLGYKLRKSSSKNFSVEIKNLKQKYQIQGDYLLYLGTLKPSKNVEGLVEAFGLLVDKRKGLKLVIAGRKGWLYESISRKVKELGLQEQVVFTGFVSDEEASTLMRGAAVFVLPSFWEGFGIPALEAMSLGTPVVASNVASLPEVVGEAGILIDPNSCQSIAEGIEKALKEKDKFSKIGLDRVRKFSWQKCAKETLAVFSKIASKKV